MAHDATNDRDRVRVKNRNQRFQGFVAPHLWSPQTPPTPKTSSDALPTSIRRVGATYPLRARTRPRPIGKRPPSARLKSRGRQFGRRTTGMSAARSIRRAASSRAASCASLQGDGLQSRAFHETAAAPPYVSPWMHHPPRIPASSHIQQSPLIAPRISPKLPLDSGAARRS